MSRKFKKISKTELEQLILKEIKKQCDCKFPEKLSLKEIITTPWRWKEGYPEDYDNLDYDVDLKNLTSTIEKDLSKVEFDMENWQAYPDPNDYSVEDSILGIKTLNNGLTFLGVRGGGDWESPVFFIIYFDGKKLRGYIPDTKGNPWNHKTKSAFGNNDEDVEESINVYGKNYEDENLKFDPKLIIEDIKERIKPS